MSEPLLSVNLQASYGVQTVLGGIRFDLYVSDSLGLVGTSGAGKSTLILSLLGLLPWRGGKVTGEVLLQGEDVLRMPEREVRRLRGNRIALVPQSPMTALNSVVSLRAHFDEAWRAHQQGGRNGLDARLEELLPEVQLSFDRAFLSRKPGEISVGQAQRVMIALALLHRPAILIADEPTSALDPVTQAEIIKLLRRLKCSAGISLLYVSHDLVSVLQLCDRVAVLDAGMLVETFPVIEIGEVRHPATRRLLQSLPVPPNVLLRYRDQALLSVDPTA